MTDHSASLALARAVYPQYAWREAGHLVLRDCGNDRVEIFNPADSRANNPNAPDQFVDVLVWLLDGDAAITANAVWYTDKEWVKHDGTRASFVNAVVAAAERVANG